MRRFVRHNRGWLAAVCLVIVVAIAMAPVESNAFCAVLVPLPALFASVEQAAFPRADAPRPATVHAPSPLASRAPPIA